YTPGTNDLINNSVTLYLDVTGNGVCPTIADSLVLTIADSVQPAIGSVAPFYIRQETEIEVCVTTVNRDYRWDTDFILVAPDGVTEVPLVTSVDPFACSVFPGGNGNADTLCFKTDQNNTLDFLDLCDDGDALTGDYEAEGPWNVIFDENPAEGGWELKVIDYIDDDASTIDGQLTNVTIVFTDTSLATGKVKPVQYSSGTISFDIQEIIGTSYQVPIGLRESCPGACDAEALVTTKGGVAPYVTYDWTPDLLSQPEDSAVSLCAGNYSVTVTDSYGCQGTTSVTVISPPEISVDEVTFDSIACNGDSTASIVMLASGGTGSRTYYLMPDSIPTESASDSGLWTGLPAGTYDIFVEDAAGCFKDSTVVIYQYPALTIDSSYVTDSVFCAGDSVGRLVVEASGAKAPYQFTLQPLNVVNDSGIFESLTAGKYWVEVTGANTCTTLTSDTLYTGNPVQLNIDTVLVDSVKCHDGQGEITVITSGGKSPYIISVGGDIYPNRGDTSTFTVDTGTHQIIVFDSYACVDTFGTVTLNNPDELVHDTLYFYDTLSCFGDSTAQIVMKASGGSGPLTYYLQPDSIPSIEADSGLWQNIWAGNFIVRAEDTNGCQLDTSITIYQYPELTIDTSYVSDSILCAGDSTARIVTVAAGGKAPYLYTLQPLNISNDSGIFDSLAAGKYWVEITDANICTSVTTDTLYTGNPDSLKIDSVTASPIACQGDLSEILVYISGGTPLYDIWINDDGSDNGNTSPKTYNKAAGTYRFVVTDANGCQTPDTAEIIVVPPPIITIDTLNFTDTLVCYGDSTGYISLKASGGRGDLTYLIVNTANDTLYSSVVDSGQFNKLIADTYTLHIIDTSGCSIDSVLTIEQKGRITITATVTDSTSCNDVLGEITANASGGTPPYEYILEYMDSTNVFDTNATGLFTNIPPGMYKVWVSDQICGATPDDDTLYTGGIGQFKIDTAYEVPIACKEDIHGIIIARLSGGTQPYEYNIGGKWNPTNGIIEHGGLGESSFTLTVRDASGCEITYPGIFKFKKPEKEFSLGNPIISPVTGCSYDSTGQIEMVIDDIGV
ncbi:MAG: hypothetical protein MI922_15760, partial [Bacteroidales bacterium]|nr:hypothetical protein [Bacteroidales bacterium]